MGRQGVKGLQGAKKTTRGWRGTQWTPRTGSLRLSYCFGTRGRHSVDINSQSRGQFDGFCNTPTQMLNTYAKEQVLENVPKLLD